MVETQNVGGQAAFGGDVMPPEAGEGQLTVYLDGHATTALAPEAAAAMAPFWAVSAANPHSPHGRGQLAASRVEQARASVAELIGASPCEIVFTSGATEANNLVLLGIAEGARDSGDPRRALVVSAVEHRSVLAAAEVLATRGFELRVAPVDGNGRIDTSALASLVDDDVLLVSVMAANNEVGVVQPLKEVVATARARNALVHSDLAQAAGKISIDVFDLDLDYASVSAHKFHGPMGVGAAFLSASAPKPRPLAFGGGQEGGLRAGTLPTPLLVGFGAAADRARHGMEQDSLRQGRLADRLIAMLRARQVRVDINCADAYRLPGSLSLRFSGSNAQDLISRLARTVFLSDGSACSAGQMKSSYVLGALGMSEEHASSTIRIYIDRYLSEVDIDFVADQIAVAARASAGCRWTDGPVASADENYPR